MKEVLIVLSVVLSIILLILIVSFVVFMLVFYSRTRKPPKEGEYPLPKGKVYEPYYDKLIEGIKIVRSFPYKEVSIVSQDKLTLRGKYYEFKKNAPIEIMFHGYRGNSERDLAGGVIRAKMVNHNVLLVDNRASGRSDGHLITFGAKEQEDCLKWIDFVVENIDEKAKIILSGVSMGASTVLLASGKPLRKNVIGIIADCGYTSAKDIIKKVLKQIHLPTFIFYPLIRLGAIIFGGFDINEVNPKEAVKKATLPIIFFHGKVDDFVPLYMSQENFNNAGSPKKRLVVMEEAGHGLCFMLEEERYLQEVREFFN